MAVRRTLLPKKGEEKEMNRVISFRREELKRESHNLLESLSRKHAEMKVRRSLSNHMGLKWHKNIPNSGFHFGHDHSIKELEKAHNWLVAAEKSGTLFPLLLKDPQNKTLSQVELTKAMATLKRQKMSIFRRFLRFIGV